MNRPADIVLLHYVTPDGKDLYEEWLKGLDNRDAARVDAYVTRMRMGNFGVTRPVGQGVQELKMDFGPGYRVYHLRDGTRIVVLLCGGDKASQQKDISKAKTRAADYWRRK